MKLENLKVNFRMVKRKEKEFFVGRMDRDFKECMITIWKMDKEKCIMQNKWLYYRELGKIINSKDD